MKSRPRRTTYANVTATLALALTLGGTSYAVATIGTGDIRNGAVTSPKIKDGNVLSRDLRDGGVQPRDVADIQLVDVPLLNGWVPYNQERGAKVGLTPDGRVVLSGGIKQSGPFDIVAGELPEGYRPTEETVYLTTNTNAGTGPARLEIDVNGIVLVETSAPNTDANAALFTSFDGLSFVP